MIISGGKYLSGKNVSENELLVILDEGKKVANQKFKNPDGSTKYNYEFKVRRSDGGEYLINVNNTSARMISDKFGSDTALWINKVVKVHTALLATGNKMILLEPVEGGI